MNSKEAVARRILALCEQRGITVNELCNMSGVSPSTVYSILGVKSQNPTVSTVKKICDGLGITLPQFFDTKEFEELEQEIR